MYISLLFMILKVVLTNEDVYFLCKNILSEMASRTKTMCGSCKKDEPRVRRFFWAKIFNPSCSELQDILGDLIRKYRKMLSARKLKSMSDITKCKNAVINVAQLRLWTQELELFLMNEYVISRISYGKDIRRLVDYIKNNNWLDNKCYDSVMQLEFDPTCATTKEIEECISYMFDIIKKSSRYVADIVEKDGV